MQGSVHGAGFVADEFHDVDFATGGPADGGDVVAEHPKGGPDAAAVGEGGADVHSAKLKGLFALCLQPGTGVQEAVEGLFFGLDDEVAVEKDGVFGTVIFEFLVAPAALSVAGFVVSF